MKTATKEILVSLVLILTTTLTGCFGIGIGEYANYYIEEFYEFTRLYSDQRVAYILDGNLDFAKVEDVVIVPMAKENRHEYCTFSVLLYSSDEPNSIQISDFSLSVQNGIALYECDYIESSTEWETLTDDLLINSITICTLEKNENWFFDESNLSWSFQVTVESSTGVLQETFHYDMVVSKHKTLTFPT